ncbi:MAG: HDOD domain-containing protein [Deltaproteobacteria bacterium]|nr:HDOD domain-containing protein [Deltaproteobacteria bacterium]
MKRKILFVDDEPNILQGLRRMLRGMRNEWHMVFAESGEEAMRILEGDPFEVVVTDMRMPGMHGAELLKKIQKKFPEIVRIVLSGHSDQELILKSVRTAHQYLSKPCDADTLKNTVARACALRELLKDGTLKQVVSNIDTLPSLPKLYQEIMAELQSEDASMDKVAKIISGDVGMSAKILQMVNSAFFALPRHIENIAQAVNLLGLETIKALVLSAQIFRQFETKGVPESFLEKLWGHCMGTATFARTIAREENLSREAVDDAFLAGMLHDVGKLVLSTGLPEKYGEIIRRAAENGISLRDVEDEVLGTTHGAVGAYLMGLWGFGDNVVEAIAFHHVPGTCPARTMGVLAAVHAANALEHASGPEDLKTDETQVDREFLNKIGVEEGLERWAQVCETEMQ